MKELIVENKRIGENNTIFIVAEMSSNHLGNFDRAVKIIQAAAFAGADAIKLQTYTPDTITINYDKKYDEEDNLREKLNSMLTDIAKQIKKG